VTRTASFPALGTTALVAVTSESALARARNLLERQLDRVDRVCSRFRADSELSLVNAAAGRRVEVSDDLRAAVGSALTAAEMSSGLVDPTVGGALKALGYDRTIALVRNRGGWQVGDRGCWTSWRLVELDEERSTLRLPAGTMLDLGATAKAEAADRAAATLASELDCGVLVSLGGDIAVAGGAPAGGWCVAVGDDSQLTASAKVTVRAGGLATSSTTVRRWPTDRGEMHHVVDPRTRRPAASCWRTVSVAAGACLDANVASTAALILGTAAPAWLAERRLPARLVANDGAVTTIAGWPSEE
jgi:thiamine biosynthesis lipoprotein